MEGSRSINVQFWQIEGTILMAEWSVTRGLGFKVIGRNARDGVRIDMFTQCVVRNGSTHPSGLWMQI